MNKLKKIIKGILLKTIFKWKILYHYRQYLKKNKKQYILFGIPEHGNIGDHAIAIAEREFLKDIGLEKVFEVPIKIQDIIIKKIKKKIQPDDIILITGGGFIGNQWMIEENMVRQVIETFPKNKTIIFPATIYYKDNEEGKNEFRKAKEIYQKHENLIICAREKKTYDFILKEYPFAKALLVPDIVLYLNKIEKCQREEKILLCLRADPEKNITNKETDYIEKIAQKYGETEYIDTVIHKRINIRDREKIFEQKLKEFKKSKLVITDRLHGMIFAAITNTPCIALGNYNYKVQGVYEWIKEMKNVKFINKVDEIDKSIQEILKFKESQFDNLLLGKWDELKNEIK